MKYGFGIDVGGTTVKLGFLDETGALLAHWEIPTDCSEGGSHILGDIARAVEDYLRAAGVDRKDVIGIGVGVPGAVDNQGIVHRCVNLGWGIVDLQRDLSRLTGLPVRAGNDANVAALGEAWLGGGRGRKNMVLATLGTGIGGGIIIDGKILHGAHGGGGEIGHIPLHPKEETECCGCGKRGCAEQYGSATGIVRTARRYLAAHGESSALRQAEPLTAKAVFDAAKAGDAAALAICELVFDDLGLFLADVCCVCDPEIVVLGGGVSKAGQILLDGVQKAFQKYIFHTGRDIPFALAALGNDAGTYGAFKLILDAAN